MRQPRRAARFVTTAVAFIIVGALQAQAQTATSHPYGLDPYKPSDADLLRNYGAVLVSQTPLLELTHLDPYKPSDAALLRQLGGAQPVCCADWYGVGLAQGLGTVHLVPPVADSRASAVAAPPANSVFVVMVPPPATSSTPPAPPVTTSAVRPETNDGVWIRFDGQIWTSAGRAVALGNLTSDRVGEYASRPVYKARGTDDVIYVQSRDGLVAPYRRKVS